MEVEITVTVAFIHWSIFLYLVFSDFGFLSILNLIFRAHLFWDFVLTDPMFPVVSFDKGALTRLLERETIR